MKRLIAAAIVAATGTCLFGEIGSRAMHMNGRVDRMVNGTEPLSGRSSAEGTELCATAERILSCRDVVPDYNEGRIYGLRRMEDVQRRLERSARRTAAVADCGRTCHGTCPGLACPAGATQIRVTLLPWIR